MNLNRVPKEIDRPVPILFWEPAEFSAGIAFMALGMVFGSMALGMALSFGILMAAKKLREGAKPGQAQHFLWRTGIPIDPAMSNFPSPYYRDFIE